MKRAIIWAKNTPALYWVRKLRTGKILVQTKCYAPETQRSSSSPDKKSHQPRDLYALLSAVFIACQEALSLVRRHFFSDFHHHASCPIFSHIHSKPTNHSSWFWPVHEVPTFESFFVVVTSTWDTNIWITLRSSNQYRRYKHLRIYHPGWKQSQHLHDSSELLVQHHGHQWCKKIMSFSPSLTCPPTPSAPRLQSISQPSTVRDNRDPTSQTNTNTTRKIKLPRCTHFECCSPWSTCPPTHPCPRP